ncbi:sigma-70 family RNA polymerase sigma factor [Flavobacteriaceae bacterium F08102]|nr:sigma-70 family RNA polymerase sigma factor [Flavobacteriaceae bacterium F08102]
MHLAYQKDKEPTENLTDQALLDELRNEATKEMAFKTLLNRYQKELYWYIRKIVLIHEDADDVLQNTFIKVFKNIDRFRGDCKLRTWMYTIAYRESINVLNKRNTKKMLSSSEINQVLLDRLEEDVHFVGSEIQLKLHKALLTLPKKQREVFQMKYFDDLKFREISEILGTSEGALKASYYIAIKKVERFLVNQLM